MAAIAGKLGPVEVTNVDGLPELSPSCRSADNGFAVPPIRLDQVIRAFGGQLTSVCADDFGPAMTALGRKITVINSGQCIDSPLLLPNGGIACHAGVDVCRKPTCGPGETCDQSIGRCVDAEQNLTENPCGTTCLDAADVAVSEVIGHGTKSERRTSIPKCPREYFLHPELPKDACGSDCPCWRIVPRPTRCTADLNVSPFGLDIMRREDPLPGTVATAHLRSAIYPWQDSKVQQAAVHCTAPPLRQ